MRYLLRNVMILCPVFSLGDMPFCKEHPSFGFWWKTNCGQILHRWLANEWCKRKFRESCVHQDSEDQCPHRRWVIFCDMMNGHAIIHDEELALCLFCQILTVIGIDCQSVMRTWPCFVNMLSVDFVLVAFMGFSFDSGNSNVWE